MALGPQFDPDKLYHGTAGEIEGGVVRPNESMYGRGAYAVYGNQASRAQDFAQSGAWRQGRLFGTVYEVTPRSELVDTGLDSQVLDPEGLNVVKAVDFPVNPEIEFGKKLGDY